MHHRFLSAVLAFSAVASFALAQGPGSSPTGIADAASQSFGVTTGPDGVHAGGPDYTARFDRSGFEFAPLAGRCADHAMPVRYTLESVRRGAVDVLTASGALPVVDGNRVRFEHGAGFVERYDVGQEGIEQSFVFATKPAGQGDLVVRGAITTDLAMTAASDAGVTFASGDVAGVTFGAVTGVDSNGASARGSIRVVGDGAHVEWVLPASFVDHAAYPLVLDPFVGNAFTVGNATGTDVLPAVSYDATIDRYLVVWTVNVSATQAEVRGQFVGGNGSIAGGLVLFDNDTPTDVRPSVANVNATDRFLVAYLANDIFSLGGQTSIIQQLYVRSASAATGAMSNPVLAVAGGPFGGPGSFDLGGDSRIGLFGSNQDALLVFEYTMLTTQSVDTMIVRVPSTGDPTFGATQSLASSAFPVGDVAVSAHAGSLGRWLVAFGQNPSTFGAPFDRIVGQAIDGAGNLCGPLLTIVNGGAAADLRHPTVATRDGSEFVIAWENANAASVNLRRFVHLGTCASGAWTGGAVLAPVVQSGNADRPALAFAKDKYLLAWSQTSGTSSVAKIYCKGLDPATCADCGRELRTDTTLLADITPAIATHWQGGDQTSDEGLLVWSNGTIRGRRVEARTDDVVAGMGGGCVNGFDDFASYSGDAVLGNADFQLAIVNSVSLPLVLVVGFSAVSVPCGNCTIVPSPDILFPATNPYTLAIPCDPTLVGVDLYTQWLLLKPSTCPILPDFSFTNALRFTIGE